MAWAGHWGSAAILWAGAVWTAREARRTRAMPREWRAAMARWDGLEADWRWRPWEQARRGHRSQMTPAAPPGEGETRMMRAGLVVMVVVSVALLLMECP